MSGYNATMRMEREQKVKVNTCGDCGVEITDSEILCQDCITREETRWEPIRTGESK